MLEAVSGEGLDGGHRQRDVLDGAVGELEVGVRKSVQSAHRMHHEVAGFRKLAVLREVVLQCSQCYHQGDSTDIVLLGWSPSSKSHSIGSSILVELKLYLYTINFVIRVICQ